MKRILLAFGLVFLGTAGAAIAQASLPHRVIHLWVDPHYGSDSPLSGSPGAPYLNPDCTYQAGNGCAAGVDLALSEARSLAQRLVGPCRHEHK